MNAPKVGRDTRVYTDTRVLGEQKTTVFNPSELAESLSTFISKRLYEIQIIRKKVDDLSLTPPFNIFRPIDSICREVMPHQRHFAATDTLFSHAENACASEDYMESLKLYCMAKEDAKSTEDLGRAYLGIAKSLDELNYDAKSFIAFDLSTAYDPTLVEGYYEKAVILYRSGDYKGAIEELNSAETHLNLPSAISSNQFYKARADVYLALRQCNKVRNDLDKIKEPISPSMKLDKKEYAAVCYYYEEDYNFALKLMNQILEEDPSRDNLYPYIAHAAVHEGYMEIADEAFGLWIDSSNKPDVDLLIDAAKVALKTGQNKKAVALLNRAYENTDPYTGNGTFGSLHLLRGMAYLGMGRRYLDEAATEISMLEEYWPDYSNFMAVWFIYKAAKVERKEPDFRKISISLTNVDADTLTQLTTGMLSPITVREMTKLFEDLLEYQRLRMNYTLEHNEIEKYKESLDQLDNLINLYRDYYSKLFKVERDSQKTSLSSIQSMQEHDPKSLKKEIRGLIELTLNLHLEYSISANIEEKSIQLAIKIAELSTKLFPDNTLFKYKLAFLTMISSQKSKVRKKAVDIVEEIFKKGLPIDISDELKEDLIVFRGLVWREYLEGLIHELPKDATETPARYSALLQGTFNKTYTMLDEAINQYPNNVESKLNMGWLHYIWAKRPEGNFDKAINYASDLVEELELKQTKAKKELCEAKRLLAWSITMKVYSAIDINKSHTALLKRSIPELTISVNHFSEARDLATARYERRDSLYGLAATNILLCGIHNKLIENGIHTSKDPFVFCDNAESNLSTLLKKEIEGDLSELFYGMGYYMTKIEFTGSLQQALNNPLFFTFNDEGNYYSESLFPFIKAFRKVNPFRFRLPNGRILDPSHVTEESKMQIIKDETRVFGAVGQLMVALMLDTPKRTKARNYLIKNLERINNDEEKADVKMENLMWIALLRSHNLSETTSYTRSSLEKLSDDIRSIRDQCNLLDERTKRGFRLPIQCLKKELDEFISGLPISSQKVELKELIENLDKEYEHSEDG